MKIFLPGYFTTLNEYISAERRNRHIAARIKRVETEAVQISTLGVLPVKKYPVSIKFVWHCKNTRSDPDNIAFAKKCILDGLQKSNVLAGDGWKQICGFQDEFVLDPENPGVEVSITEVR